MKAMLVGLVMAAVLVVSAAAAPGSKPARWYLSLGDSMAYGYQPGPPRPANTYHTGYTDVFGARLEQLAPGLRVVNYGCPGESTATFARGGCAGRRDVKSLHNSFNGTQLAAAIAFLRAHPGQVSPVTITLWGTDVPLPLSQNAKHVPKLVAAFAARYGSILRKLRAAAPDAVIIVTGAWNPEADAVAQADPLYRSLDAAIRHQAASAHARVADMFAALDGTGTPAARKARLCRLTYICSKGDPHPTDAGYRAMAAAFLKASGF